MPVTVYYSFALLCLFGCRSCDDANERQIYKQARVVGITCATANLIFERGHEVVTNFGTFPIVLFEDSPRFIESVGLDCCRLAKCSAVVSVGDPKQQIGTLFQDDKPVTRGGKECTDGIGVSFFGHTEECGDTILPLHTQYRCPYYLAKVASKLFYGDTVKNTGDNKASHIAPLPGLPCFTIVNTPDSSEEKRITGGFINVVEANSIAETAHLLVMKGCISPSCICVIALFSEQIRMVHVVIRLKSYSVSPKLYLSNDPTPR